MNKKIKSKLNKKMKQPQKVKMLDNKALPCKIYSKIEMCL